MTDEAEKADRVQLSTKDELKELLGLEQGDYLHEHKDRVAAIAHKSKKNDQLLFRYLMEGRTVNFHDKYLVKWVVFSRHVGAENLLRLCWKNLAATDQNVYSLGWILNDIDDDDPTPFTVKFKALKPKKQFELFMQHVDRVSSAFKEEMKDVRTDYQDRLQAKQYECIARLAKCLEWSDELSDLTMKTVWAHKDIEPEAWKQLAELQLHFLSQQEK